MANAPMNPRDRVLLSIQHTQTDIVPFHISFTPGARKKVVDYYGHVDLERAIDNHLVIFKARLPYKEIRPGFWEDEFGVVWNRTNDESLGVVTEYILEEKSLDAYRFPDPHNPAIYHGLERFIADNRDRFRVVNIGHALFERAWSLRGMVPLLVEMVDFPAKVEALLDAITEYQLGVIENLEGFEIDALMFGDDWGQQKSLLFSPAMWRKSIKPRLHALYSAVKRSGKYVFHHSCGQVQSLFPDLIEIGLDVFNPFQPDVMDIFDIKEKYGRQLAFYGGVSVQKLLPFGTPDEIKTQVEHLAATIGKDGGYILAPSHDIPGDVPLENILALIEAVKNQ